MDRETDQLIDEGEQFLWQFARWSSNPAVARRFHESLGPAGTLSVLVKWARGTPGSDREAALQMALTRNMRVSMETASRSAGFGAVAFAHGLVEESARTEGGTTDFALQALDFLLVDSDFGSTFLTTIADELDVRHRRHDSATRVDPMPSLMTSLRRAPRVALDFLAGQGRAPAYLHDRDWDDTGFDALLAVLVSATTSADLIKDPLSQTGRKATALTASAIGLVAARTDFERLARRAAQGANTISLTMARVLATYMADVGSTVADSDTEHGIFALEPLSRCVRLALASEAGFNEMRMGVADYQIDMIGWDGQLEAGSTSAQVEDFFVSILQGDPTKTEAERHARVEAWKAAD